MEEAKNIPLDGFSGHQEAYSSINKIDLGGIKPFHSEDTTSGRSYKPYDQEMGRLLREFLVNRMLEEPGACISYYRMQQLLNELIMGDAKRWAILNILETAGEIRRTEHGWAVNPIGKE